MTSAMWNYQPFGLGKTTSRLNVHITPLTTIISRGFCYLIAIMRTVGFVCTDTLSVLATAQEKCKIASSTPPIVVYHDRPRTKYKKAIHSRKLSFFSRTQKESEKVQKLTRDPTLATSWTKFASVFS